MDINPQLSPAAQEDSGFKLVMETISQLKKRTHVSQGTLGSCRNITRQYCVMLVEYIQQHELRQGAIAYAMAYKMLYGMHAVNETLVSHQQCVAMLADAHDAWDTRAFLSNEHKKIREGRMFMQEAHAEFASTPETEESSL